MKILVTSHENADLDALASSVAAAKLHRSQGHDVTIGLGRRLAPEVANFLALHRRRFPIVRCNQIDLLGFDALVVTDVRRKQRLKHVAPLLEKSLIEVWDHHPASDDDLRCKNEHIALVGAVTTLFVEELQSREVELDAMEATLFALGIQADTGCLTHATTTPRDARAYAWLLEHGAALSVIERYLEPPMDEAQQALLVELLEHAEQVEVNGAQVAMSRVKLPKSTAAGLARITSEAAALSPCSAFFALYELKKKVQVVGRARAPVVDVGHVLSELGGGGHAGAGAAIVNGDADEVLAQLRLSLWAAKRKTMSVREVMSSPVHSVDHRTKVGTALERFIELDITGAPVFADGKMIGLISIRDLQKAERSGQLELPVKGRMSHEVHAIGPDVPVGQALELMTKHDVGRLPVLESDEVIGIISRTDALRVLYK